MTQNKNGFLYGSRKSNEIEYICGDICLKKYFLAFEKNSKYIKRKFLEISSSNIILEYFYIARFMPGVDIENYWNFLDHIDYIGNLEEIDNILMLLMLKTENS